MLTFYNIVKGAFYKISAVAISLLMTLSNGINSGFNGDIYPYESNSKVFGLETIERAQGVTTDGEAWYFSGKSTLVKIAFDNQTVLAYNYEAIPEELAEAYGSAHIGGISYCDGYIYAPLEDSKVWEYPIIAVYDAETLEFTGEYKVLSNEILTRGMSWLSCDEENGLIYSSHSKEATELYCFDLETFEYVKTVELSEMVGKIQGGEVYNGLIYVGTNDATRAVYTINPSTGEVEKCFDRIMYEWKLIDNFGGEGQDVTVYPMEDGTLIHALDIGALFMDSNLRHYKWEA